MRRFLHFILTAMVIGTISSCTKQTTTVQTLAYTGSIDGHIMLYDQYGSRVLTGLSKADVSVQTVAENPDSNGYYIFSNAGTGVYNITVTDSGYATTQTNNFQYLGDTLNKDIKLSAIPAFSPISYAVYPALSTPGDSIVLNFNADTRARNCILFINNGSTVNSIPPNYLLVYTKAIAANKTSAFIIVPSADFTDAGIAGGATVYCAGYGYVVSDGSVYEDQTTRLSLLLLLRSIIKMCVVYIVYAAARNCGGFFFNMFMIW